MIKRKQIKISRERAITIAMNHNCVSKEIAQNYTDSELKEVLKQLKLKQGFRWESLLMKQEQPGTQ